MFKTTHFKSLWLILTTLSIYFPTVYAEKKDAYQPATIESDRATLNELSQIRTFEGNVVVNKGSLMIYAHTLELSVDAQGYQTLKAIGTVAKPVFFKQKREGLDETIEAQGVRLVFNGKADSIILNDQAIVRRLAKGVVQDEVRGATIIYHNQTEFYDVQGGATSSHTNGRVRAVIAPRKTK